MVEVLREAEGEKIGLSEGHPGGVSNDAEGLIGISEPYRVEFELTGVEEILFHRWSNEAVEAKSKAAKNSAAKKTDNLESYVYRDDNGLLCLPGEYVRQSIIVSAKSKPDPRSPRKSARDLFQASVLSLTNLAVITSDAYPKGTKRWDREDRRRAVVQRSAITRIRPAMSKGWRASFVFLCASPEYISVDLLHDVLVSAGRLVGVADFRPTFGRFAVTTWRVLRDVDEPAPKKRRGKK